MPVINQPYIQAPPYAIQIELAEGCNLRCSFCGLNGIRGRENNVKAMSVNHAFIIAERIREADWHPRIEFAMHGEPSLNPNFIQILKEFRLRLPKGSHMMMTSNGAGFVKNPTQLVDEVVAEVNVLALDDYENVNLVPKILEHYKGNYPPKFYPAEPEANPHRRRKIQEHDFVIVQDISEATKGTHSTLNNHAGCGAPKNGNGQGKRCAKPFRELSIRWDGSIAICCNDWRGYYKCGNAIHQSLEEIWQGEAFVAARRKLYHGLRDFGPCAGCDAISYRPGLLPDQLGKQTLPLPTAKDQAAIDRALAGQPYTLPVWRPWETTTATQDSRADSPGPVSQPVASEPPAGPQPSTTGLRAGTVIQPMRRA